MESCTLAHLLILWEGTSLFSVPWEIIIQSEQSSMIQDGWMVNLKFFFLKKGSCINVSFNLVLMNETGFSVVDKVELDTCGLYEL